jgi:hypothetical protein
MRKIPSLFMRNYDSDRLVRNEVVPGSEWVLAGEGMPTRKLDGSPVLIMNGIMHVRYDAKNGKAPPQDFIPAQEPDPVTGHWPGWVFANPVQHKWFIVAVANAGGTKLPDGTYEACGPHFNKNPENLPYDTVIKHGLILIPGNPRTYNSIREYLSSAGIEGIVWHHPDGRMVKIKTRDFGLKR